MVPDIIHAIQNYDFHHNNKLSTKFFDDNTSLDSGRRDSGGAHCKIDTTTDIKTYSKPNETGKERWLYVSKITDHN